MEKYKTVPGKHNRHIPAFLLLFLAPEDAHGGALWNHMSSLMPEHFGIDSGAVYRVLRELEERGCLTSYWNTDDAGPAKRIYHMTPAGFAELAMWYEDIRLRIENLTYFVTQYEALTGVKAMPPESDQ